MVKTNIKRIKTLKGELGRDPTYGGQELL